VLLVGTAPENFVTPCRMSSVLRGSGFRSAVARPMVGDTKTSMVRVDHLGWLVCDGRSLLKSEYRALYAVLGDSFGSVDADHFNLPDAQGRVVGLIGQSTSNTWIDGDLSGEETHTLVIAEIPAHNHDICGGDPTANGNTSYSATGVTTQSAGAHTHTVNWTAVDDTNFSGTVPAIPNSDTGGAQPAYSGIVNSDGAHTHAITDPTHRHQIASNGGDQPHNNMQPTIFMGNLFVFCGRVVHNVTDIDGISVPVANPSYYPPSTPPNLLY
jgi:microcystin-dependent protein